MSDGFFPTSVIRFIISLDNVSNTKTELSKGLDRDRYMYLLSELYFMSSTDPVTFISILSINDASIKSNDKKLKQKENNKMNTGNCNRCFTTT